MVPSEEISETDFFEIVIGRSKTPRKYKQCIADQVQVFLFIFLAAEYFHSQKNICTSSYDII